LCQYYVLAFIHIGSRNVVVSKACRKPDKIWMKAQAEAFLEHDRKIDGQTVTLLSILNLALALRSAPRLDAPSLCLASRALLGSLVLLPARFFLGGLWIYGGDPGPGSRSLQWAG